MYVRLYNKSVQVVEEKKEWWIGVWQESKSYKEGKEVWRLEIEVRREALKGLGLSSPRDALGALQGIWHYGLRWLVLKKRSRNQQKCRWPDDPKWQALRDAGFEGTVCAKVRQEKKRADLRRILRVYGGAVTSFAADNGITSLNVAASRLTSSYSWHLVSKRLSFEEIVERKRRERTGVGKD